MTKKAADPPSSQPGRDLHKFLPYLSGAGIVILVLGGLIAWGMLSQPPKSNNQGKGAAAPLTGVVSTGSTYTTCLAKFHDEELCRFAATESAQPLDKTAYRATFSANQKGVTTGLIYTQDGQGNTTLTTSKNDAVQIDSVTYQGNSYIKAGDAWVKYPSNSSLSKLAGNPAGNLSFLNSLITQNLTKEGSGRCGNDTCLKYRLIDPSTPQATNYLWFDTQHYLLREWSSTDPTTGQIDMKINYQPVHIGVPSPVQEVSAGQ
jgi:hypothetical protein